ncbi:hypothetical protein R1sor_023714 [Riccia sorocarpa]|uniref:Protein kinase domain-containing protein n=1 Tax=Riccia sorocarpa TaxID=122646 RepID=A0ABD3GNJ9_9MARC
MIRCSSFTRDKIATLNRTHRCPVDRVGRELDVTMSGPGEPVTRVAKTWVRNGILKEKLSKSTIYLCTSLENNQRFISKTIDAHELEPRTMIEMERRLYQKYKPIESPYFPKYLGFNLELKCPETDGTDVCNLLLEWVPRGSLKIFLRRQKHVLDEKIITVFCRDILRGLAYLHSQGKVHGDIKCSNILVGDKNLKICDLGKGKVQEDGELYLQPKRGQNPFRKRVYTTGSDGYMAPEVEDEIAQGPKADIYALGCTLVEMATGFPPQKVPRIYTSEDPKDNDPSNGIPKSTLHIQTFFSPEFHDFLDACLAAHPDCRLSAESALQHPWFHKFPLEYPIKTKQSEASE